MNVVNRQDVSDRISRYLLALLIIQPLLDVLSYWMNALGYGTSLTITLRLLLLLVTLVLGWSLSERKSIYWIMLAVMAVVAGCHVFACVRASGICGGEYSPAAAIIDLTNYVRVVQLPIFTLCFITFLHRADEKGLQTAQRGVVINLMIIALVELLSAATGTNPYTYANKSIGLLGWFYITSSQSAILSMLAPLVLCEALKQKAFWKTAVGAVLCVALLWLFATRLAYLAIFITLIGTMIVWGFNRRLTKKTVALLLVLMIACAATYPISPMTKNQRLVTANAVKKQADIDRLMKKGTEEFGEDNVQRYQYAYQKYEKNIVKKFGLERVVEAYHGSDQTSELSNNRLMKITYCRLMLEDLPQTSKLFGLNYNDMHFGGDTFDVENDFHGILYLYGYLGVFCFALFFGYFLWLIVRALLKNFKRYFTVDAGACGVALCCALIHAYQTSGVMRRPNATVYLSLILAMIWYLVRQRRYPDTEEVLP